MTDVVASLQGWQGRADTLSMLTAEAEILSLDLDCFRLLQNYRETCLGKRADRAKAQKAADEEAKSAEGVEDQQLAEPSEPDAAVPEKQPTPFDADKGDPWVDRICDLDGVEPDDLCKLHGKLIAAGFINFQMRNRTSGLEYRVANAGKQYLTRKLTQASELTAEAAQRDDQQDDIEPSGSEYDDQ